MTEPTPGVKKPIPIVRITIETRASMRRVPVGCFPKGMPVRTASKKWVGMYEEWSRSVYEEEAYTE